jgi:glycerol-3-phosphate acyltransferase PlsY
VETLILLTAYLIGSFPTAYIAIKLLTGKDIRDYGSHNVGALNALRFLRKRRMKRAAILVPLLIVIVDGSKAIVSFLIAKQFAPLIAFLAPMFAIFGHNYPVWLKFKGGRGLAALLGFFLYINPISFLVFLLIQGTIVLFTRRFAPGAILALLTTLPFIYILGGVVYISQTFAEFPVWLRYREKYLLMKEGKLEVGM